jgi:hypothetical protein
VAGTSLWWISKEGTEKMTPIVESLSATPKLGLRRSILAALVPPYELNYQDVPVPLQNCLTVSER